MIYVAGKETEEDFLRLQQEAIRRVREMQSRARRTLEENGMHIENRSDNELPKEENSYNKTADNAEMPNSAYPHPSATTSFPYKKNFGGNQSENNSTPSPAAKENNNIGGGFSNPFASLFGGMGQNSGGYVKTDNRDGSVNNSFNNSQRQRENVKNSSDFFGTGGSNNGKVSGKKPPESHGNSLDGLFPGGFPIPLSGLNINLDKDQLMLMGMLYVLFKDGGDKWLMLALAYILFT